MPFMSAMSAWRTLLTLLFWRMLLRIGVYSFPLILTSESSWLDQERHCRR